MNRCWWHQRFAALTNIYSHPFREGVMDRGEHREEIKLRLEYMKVAMSIAGIVLIVLAVLQWKAANTNATQAVYQHMTKEWIDHLKIMVEKPGLRPYFEDAMPLPLDGELRQQVLAMAQVRLDTMDAILTFAAVQGKADEIQGWRSTFFAAFRNSVVLCDLAHLKKSEYGKIIPISLSACATKR
jgi:hypothetical protein